MKKYKVLNLYAGIGGNRKLWTDCEVTAVELNPEIAAIYQDFFPDDKVIIADAHQYLLDHFKEFDFIWSSRPCQSHSRARYWSSKGNESVKEIYPDLKLYEEIIFLNNYFAGKWVAENVVPYYEPLIKPSIKIGRHLFWTNFQINKSKFKDADIKHGNINEWQELHGLNISEYKINNRKDQILRNCVNPELGLSIFNRARNIQIEENTPQLKISYEL